MKKHLFLALILFSAFSLSSCGNSSPNPCLMSEDFIKSNLNYPADADFNFLDCHSTDNGNNEFTVLRKITAKNAFGVSKDYIYKVRLKFNGGVTVDENNWELIDMRSETYRD